MPRALGRAAWAAHDAGATLAGEAGVAPATAQVARPVPRAAQRARSREHERTVVPAKALFTVAKLTVAFAVASAVVWADRLHQRAVMPCESPVTAARAGAVASAVTAAAVWAGHLIARSTSK